MLKPLFAILMSCLLAGSAWGQRLLLAPADFNRINQQAQAGGWAASTRTAIITAAESWPAAYLTKYNLTKPEIPAEERQWWHWYVCPAHGVRLKFTAPNRHNCPVDNRANTGWSYDQVILAERQEYLAKAALDNGLAFQLTGNEAFATAAVRLLVDYATIYSTYTLHDINSRNARSGARATAQTLDEAIWLINLAWAYDLVAGSRVWQTGERERGERDLLWNAVAAIQRNVMRESNWQSWHNTAIGVVGYALDNTTLISQARHAAL